MKRPIGVTVLATLTILGGLYSFVFCLLLTEDFRSMLRRALAERETWGVLVSSVPFVWSIGWTVAGIGLWKLWNWGRRLVIFLCLLGMFGVCFMYWRNFGADLSHVAHWAWLLPMAVYGLPFGYMFTSGVKRAFSS